MALLVLFTASFFGFGHLCRKVRNKDVHGIFIGLKFSATGVNGAWKNRHLLNLLGLQCAREALVSKRNIPSTGAA